MHVYGEIEGKLAPKSSMSGDLAPRKQLDGELTIPSRIASQGIYVIHVAYDEAWGLVDTTYTDIADAYADGKELRVIDDTNVIVAYFSKENDGTFYFSAVDGSSGSAYSVIEYSIADEEVLVNLYENTETDPTVPSWAKQPTKPSYTAQEVGALPDNTPIPSKTSDLQNDAGYLTAETDPTVPSWAKQQSKPSYTAQEVGALPDDTQIPSKTSDLTNDSLFIHGNTKGIFYGTSPTGASVAEKAVTCAEFTAADRTAGTIVFVMMTKTNTASVDDLKLNVNSTGARSIRMIINGELAKLPARGYLKAAWVYPFYFDGDYWICLMDHTPENVSELTNDAGYLTGYTETDPTVPSWAKQQSKPSYTAQEVGALPDNTPIPSKTSDLQNDSGFITVSDVPEEIFWAEYGTTTSAEIEAAFQAGKQILCYWSSRVYNLIYRGSATSHTFGYVWGNTTYRLACSSNSWSNTSASNQPKITASGMLKSDGTNVSAAVEGTDYLTLATLPVYSGGVS